MKRLPSIPLRILLPVLLLSCAAIAGVISWKLNARLLAGEIESQFLDEARLRVKSLQATLEYHFRTEDTDGVKAEVSALARRDDVIAACVLDEGSRVVAATGGDERIDNAADVIAAGLPGDLKGRQAAQMAHARASAQGSVALSDDGSVAVAYYPLHDLSRQSVQNGLLVLVLDTQIAKGRAFKAAGRQAANNGLILAGLAAFAWLFIHFGLTRRVAVLVATTRRLASGDLAARTGIDGGDELAQVAGAIDSMAERLAVDIPRREKVEGKLRESELRFRQMAENIQQVFWMVSSEGDELIYISPAYERIWGRTRASIHAEPLSWLDSIVDEDRPSATADFGRAVNGESYDAEFRITRPDGSQRWIHDRGFPVCDPDGKVIRLCGIAEDITVRKASEHALKENQRHLRGLIDGLGPSLFVALLTPRGIMVEVNQSPLTAAGLKPEDVLGKPFDETPWWRGSEEVRRQLRGAIARAAGGEASRYDVRIRGVGDEVIDVDFSLLPLRDETGEVVFVVPSASVITERIRTEGALRESEERFRGTFEQAPVGIAHVSIEGRFLRVNDKLCVIAGYDREELLAMTFVDLTVPEDRAVGEDARRAMLDGKQSSFTTEKRYRRKDGDVVWANLVTTLERTTDGTPKYFISVFEDITARKLAETALRESKHFAESIAENSTSIIYLFDLETRSSTYSNRSAAEFLGYSPAQIIEFGDNLLERIIHPDDLPPMAQRLTRFSEVPDHQVIDIEYRVKHASGDWRWMWVRETVFSRRPNGAVWQIMGTAQDITERKRAAAELENVYQQLLETSRQAGMAEVATSVLHNVGNVLNSVNISAGLIFDRVKKSRASSLAKVVALLQEHAQDPGAFITNDPRGKHVPALLAQLSTHLMADQEAVAGELDLLRRNVEHINEIVAMQQSYATFGGVKEMISVVDLVEDSMRMDEAALKRHRIEVIREFDKVPLMNVEKHKILQILVNLVHNAQHACRDSDCSDRRLTMGVTGDGDHVRISVTDNGIGIPPENLTRIFNHGFTTRKDGHGFGLHSSALAAQEMGGSLTVHSDGPGKGATFVLELPLNVPAHRTRAPLPPPVEHLAITT